MPEYRRGQHLVQPAQGCRGQQCRDRADPAGCEGAGPHPDAVGDGAPHRQHDVAGGGRRRRQALSRFRWPVTGQGDEKPGLPGFFYPLVILVSMRTHTLNILKQLKKLRCNRAGID
ncbi:hypothetical protein CBM2608_A280008 [Cupriavidus taiwanensis]|nr:hypothetical protein CBM2608_A280008 [Cupriavidus taiwanensis]SPA45543.1 hypothetical protein CBM2629_A240016 [Cupriavidus taiwanensis]SPD44377.1 conserved protein of unknown function [Cupriavidus taiwanensis]